MNHYPHTDLLALSRKISSSRPASLQPREESQWNEEALGPFTALVRLGRLTFSGVNLLEQKAGCEIRFSENGSIHGRLEEKRRKRGVSWRKRQIADFA